MGAGEQSYFLCPVMCGCKRGRGEDGKVLSVVGEGLRTDVSGLFFWGSVSGGTGNMWVGVTVR